MLQTVLLGCFTCLHEENLLPTLKEDGCWHFWRSWQNVRLRAQRLLSWPRRGEWLAMKYMGINGASQKQASFMPASPAKVEEGDMGSPGRKGLNSQSERGERHGAQLSYTTGSSDNSRRAPSSDLGRQGLWRHTSLQSLSGEGHGTGWSKPWIGRWSSEPNASCRVQTIELSRKLRQKLISLALLWYHRNSGVRGMSGLHQTQLGPHLRGLKLRMCLDQRDLGTLWEW